MGLPIVTNSKYIVMVASDMQQENSRGTFIKLIYLGSFVIIKIHTLDGCYNFVIRRGVNLET